jgi:pyruvate dehydrogenase E2 component (dihydrolipoamide acetyltransferase)
VGPVAGILEAIRRRRLKSFQVMPTIIKMPAFSATMETAKLLRWLVVPGDSVTKGQVLAEIETDKAVATIEAPESGQLRELLVPAGDDDLPVNTHLAILASEATKEYGGEPAGSRLPSSLTASVTQPSASSGSRSPSRFRASPAARALARQHGLDLALVAGSGPRGRIVSADILGLASPVPNAVPVKTIEGPSAAGGEVAAHQAEGTDRAAQLRLSMARALVHAKTSVPHFYAELDIGVDALLESRKKLALGGERRAPTVTAYLICGVAAALREVPAVNRYWAGQSIEQRSACNIGCAVGLHDRVALPVLRHVDRLSVGQVDEELRRLTGLARTGALTQKDMGDASLTISNLGMHGIDRFFPIVNVPESLILGIGQARRIVHVVDDLIGLKTVLSCTVSVDHRVIDGELVGRFLRAFKGAIEDPRILAG